MRSIRVSIPFKSQIESSDGLPQHVCTQCASELRIAFAYKKRCEESDAKLRDYFREHLSSAHVKLESMDLPPEELMDCNWLENVQSLAVADTVSAIHHHFQGSEYDEDTHADSHDVGTPTLSDDEKMDAPCIGAGKQPKSEDERSELVANNETRPSTVAKEGYKCEICFKPFKFFGAYNRHKFTHETHPEKRFTCDVCHGKFTRLYNLR